MVRLLIWFSFSFMLSGWGDGFPIHGSVVENHWVAPKSTQLFILRRLFKWVQGIPGDLAVKNKLSPCSGSVVSWDSWTQSLKRENEVFFYYYHSITWTATIQSMNTWINMTLVLFALLICNQACKVLITQRRCIVNSRGAGSIKKS